MQRFGGVFTLKSLCWSLPLATRCIDCSIFEPSVLGGEELGRGFAEEQSFFIQVLREIFG